MVNVLHRNLTGADAVHPAAFVQSSDPGAVGANLIWIDTTTGPPYTLKLRNSSNTAWLLFAAGAVGATGPTGPQGPQGQGGVSLLSTVVTGGQPYICFKDQKAQNTAGGTFTSGAQRTRTLNTIVANDMSLATLLSNQITLPAGTYRCAITCPAFAVGNHQARLQNISTSSTAIAGTSEFNNTTGNAQNRSLIFGVLGLTSATIFEIQHICQTTQATQGFGTAANFGTEVYTIAEFWLVGGPPPFFGSTGPTELPSFEKIRRQSRAAMY